MCRKWRYRAKAKIIDPSSTFYKINQVFMDPNPRRTYLLNIIVYIFGLWGYILALSHVRVFILSFF